MSTKDTLKKALGFTQAEPVKVDPKNRFYYMLQQMQANRWRITAIVLGLFFFIILGINSAVFFKVEIPNTYPHTPPLGTFVTTNNSTRFNPNLYVNGKICLSILGTWQGPGWSSTMNIRTVINSIQGLVMNETPIINEPAYENTTLDYKVNYNYYVEYHSINYALCEQLLNINQHQPFDKIKDKLVSYFLKYSDKLLIRLDKLIETRQLEPVNCNYVSAHDKYDYVKLKEKVIDMIDKITK